MEYHLKRKEDDDKLLQQKSELRQELDACMLDKEKQAAAEKKQSEIDEEKMKIYTKTKRVIYIVRVCIDDILLCTLLANG